jgi:hypothetical protein
VRVQLRSFGPSVRGRAELLVKRGGRHRATRISQRTFRAAAGAPVRLTMRVNRRGRAFVRSHRRVTAWVRVTARADGVEHTRRMRVRLRAPR